MKTVSIFKLATTAALGLTLTASAFIFQSCTTGDCLWTAIDLGIQVVQWNTAVSAGESFDASIITQNLSYLNENCSGQAVTGEEGDIPESVSYITVEEKSGSGFYKTIKAEEIPVDYLANGYEYDQQVEIKINKPGRYRIRTFADKPGFVEEYTEKNNLATFKGYAGKGIPVSEDLVIEQPDGYVAPANGEAVEIKLKGKTLRKLQQ